jgi:hypothetical protein
MPNHCANRLTIRGSKKKLEVFLNDFTFKEKGEATNYLYLQKYNKQLTDMYTQKCGKIQDTSSSMAHMWTPYGTKWGCYEFSEPIWSQGKLVLIFKTAWCPYNSMTQVFMSQQFPSLKFHLEYAECGQCFVGDYKAVGGKLTTNTREAVYTTGKVAVIECEDGSQRCEWKPGYDQYRDLWNMSG